MSHPSLPPLNALAAYEAVRSGEQAYIESQVFQRQSPDWKPTIELEDLLSELSGLHDLHGLQANGLFESQACVLLHSSLAITSQAAADAGFWRWLSLGPLLPLIQLRHESLRPEHVGLGSPWDALLSRLWYRADLSFDSDEDDPYALAKLGDLDFWRSHVLRADYSACRPLLRALLRFQFPEHDQCRPRLKPSGSSEDGMRALAKRIKLRHAVVAFELLDEEQCMRELQVLAAGLD